MRLPHLCFALVVGAAALAACNPYDPQLGPRPFRCGAEAPFCPIGYECVEYSSAQRVCERSSGAGQPDAGVDGSTFQCNDDSSIEPNDQITQAWISPIPDFASCTRLVGLAICPDTDKDHYRFGVAQNGKNMRTVLTAEGPVTSLELEVLNRTGSRIAGGVATSSSTLEVVVNNLPQDQYYIKVGSAEDSGVRSNYALEIITCDQSGCPDPCP
jgi:hypothetical protein